MVLIYNRFAYLFQLDMAETSDSLLNGSKSAEYPQTESLSVTEYASNPSAPELHPTKPRAPPLVPKEFLAPDGYPDVCGQNPRKMASC